MATRPPVKSGAAPYRPIAIACLAAAWLTVPAQAKQQPAIECGKASWYELTSKTASGERADPNALAAAHRSLPFGTRVRVSNLSNGKEVVVRINDRGPFVRGRVIDVTRAAADKLGFRRQGVARVKVAVVDANSGKNPGGTCPD
jgi:rare lipoprotein A